MRDLIERVAGPKDSVDDDDLVFCFELADEIFMKVTERLGDIQTIFNFVMNKKRTSGEYVDETLDSISSTLMPVLKLSDSVYKKLEDVSGRLLDAAERRRINIKHTGKPDLIKNVKRLK